MRADLVGLVSHLLDVCVELALVFPNAVGSLFDGLESGGYSAESVIVAAGIRVGIECFWLSSWMSAFLSPQ